MPRVHILTEEIISKIAAGEVIERPASVIKELLENALDAGATSIEIILKDAGKTLIQLRDNGHGIDRDDLDKVFIRHSTSKIKSVEDLYEIHSLGFRGEALYSIGAVSEVTLRSRGGPPCPPVQGQPQGVAPTQDVGGWEINISGGKQGSVKPCAFSNIGTEIEIANLFFNTPARKKFLRSNTAEMQQILNTVIPYAILHKHIRLRLIHQDKTLLDLSPAETTAERMAATLGLEQRHLIRTSQAFAQDQVTVKMILGDINIKRSRRDMQFFFINNRPVFSKTIAFHMNQIYRLIMAPDENGAYALFINMPAREIDVNIHPTKREVKLSNETVIGSIIRSMCEQALMEKSAGKIISRGAVAAPSMFGRGDHAPTELFSNSDYAFPDSNRVAGVIAPGVNDFYVPGVGAVRERPLQQKLACARFIGSFINKYLIFESGHSLYLVDQHAAQERIFYEKFIVQLDKGNVEIQHLLSPILVRLSPSEQLVMEELGEDLEGIGLSATMFDAETLAVHAHPALMKDVEKAVRGLLAGDKQTKFDHDAIARRACRSSIMTGDRLSKEQAEFQRDELLRCLDPFTCPHGRPIVVELPEDFLDKQFLRT